MFFVLSGFLVSGLLFQEAISHQGAVNIWRFLLRRGFKIYPSFWVLIGVTVLLDRLFRVDYRPYAPLCELAFIQNYGRALWNHTWSLAVEEHFYISLVLFLILLTRFNRGSLAVFESVPAVAVGVLALVFVSRTFVAFRYPWDFKATVFPTHLRVDSLAFGVLLSWFYWFRGNELAGFVRRRQWQLLCGGSLLLLPPFILPLEGSRVMSSVGFVGTYLGAGMILLFAVYRPPNMGLWFRGFARMGFYSYSIYLWHAFFLRWLMPSIGRLPGCSNYSIYWTIALAGAFVFGTLAAKVVELPALHLREIYFPNTTRSESSKSMESPHADEGRGTSPGIRANIAEEVGTSGCSTASAARSQVS
jgi:peptidoglycan/LPS O-acetylase OafA/YrhL